MEPRRCKGVKDSAPKIKELFKAIRESNLQDVLRLVRKDKVNVNSRDLDNQSEPTPLLVATELQNADIIRVLLTAKQGPANINMEDRQGRRPIWLAAYYGNSDLAELLLLQQNQTCDINYPDPTSGCTPLYRAILSRATDVCRLLVRAGADVNLRRLGVSGHAAQGESPLIKAVQMDLPNICEILINSLCDINAADEMGMTALHNAVAYRRYNITEILLQNSADLHKNTRNGFTPMTICIRANNPYLVRLLVEYGYNMDHVFEWHQNPLECAISLHSEACAMTLVHWGCKLEPSDSTKPSVFNQAASEGLTELMKLLVDVQPLFLNTAWVRQQQPPLALYKKSVFAEWLFTLAEKPRLLSELCRVKINRYLGKCPCSKVDQLPLPKTMKEFLWYKSYFPRSLYRLRTLHDKDCPFECPPQCHDTNINCPDIDITTSSEEFDSEDEDFNVNN